MTAALSSPSLWSSDVEERSMEVNMIKTVGLSSDLPD